MLNGRRLLAFVKINKDTRPVLSLFGISAAITATVVLTMALKTPRIMAGEDDDHDRDKSKIAIGFSIAPVPLNLKGKDKALVGLGSYIINAQADCNGCHTTSPQTEYTPTGNPYLLRPPKGPFNGMRQANPATYLAGGSDFGPYPGLAHLYSRNLTPDKSGRAAGGMTYKEFFGVIRTGKDFDHLHPPCTGAPDGTCIPAPFNGDLLQVMPWPNFQNMSDREIRAMYEYLSAIPCIDTVIAGAPVLRNSCQ
jgi:hypothetical protein